MNSMESVSESSNQNTQDRAQARAAWRWARRNVDAKGLRMLDEAGLYPQEVFLQMQLPGVQCEEFADQIKDFNNNIWNLEKEYLAQDQKLAPYT